MTTPHVSYAAPDPELNPFDALGLPNTYVPAVRIGSLVLVGGQTAISPRGDTLFPGHMPVQTAIALRNLERALQSVGAGLGDIARLNSYYVGDDDWQRALEVRGAFFAAGPVSTGLGVHSLLAVPGIVYGVEAVAVIGETKRFVTGDGDVVYPGRVPFRVTCTAGLDRWIAGVSGVNPDQSLDAPGDITAQTQNAMSVLERRLSTVNARLEDVGQLRTFWVPHDELATALEARDARFASTPPTVDVMVPSFPTPGMTMEMDVPVLLPASGAEGRIEDEIVYTRLILPHGGQRRSPVRDMAACLDGLADALARSGRCLDEVAHLHWYYADEEEWTPCAAELWSRITTPTVVTAIGVSGFPGSRATTGLTAVVAPPLGS